MQPQHQAGCNVLVPSAAVAILAMIFFTEGLSMPLRL